MRFLQTSGKICLRREPRADLKGVAFSVTNIGAERHL
ncbi:MAG: hypothetical protein RJB29_778 [Actinomycetota bacterium]|jgi:hypothetical protein